MNNWRDTCPKLDGKSKQLIENKTIVPLLGSSLALIRWIKCANNKWELRIRLVPP